MERRDPAFDELDRLIAMDDPEPERRGRPPARLTLDTGEVVSLTQAAQRIGISIPSLHRRLKKWPTSEALRLPRQRQWRKTRIA